MKLDIKSSALLTFLWLTINWVIDAFSEFAKAFEVVVAIRSTNVVLVFW